MRVLIVDDHESVRAGLRFLISADGSFEVVGEAWSVETALSSIDSLAPEIVVLDFALGPATSDHVLDALAGRPSPPRVLMLSMEDERVVGQELARRGASAYVQKMSPTAEILEALRRIRLQILAGGHDGSVMSDAAAAAPPVRLTKREREVLMLVKEGLASKMIARRLRISEKTVDVHKHQLRRKLRLRTDMDLVRHASLFAQSELKEP